MNLYLSDCSVFSQEQSGQREVQFCWFRRPRADQDDSKPFHPDEINGSGKSIADGREGRKSLLLSNAIYFSSWEKKMVAIPKIGSAKELDFEQGFEEALKKKIVALS